LCVKILLMIIVALLVLGLVMGSFVNALVWRLHEQETEQAKKKPNKAYLKRLSMSRGRSMCSNCHHELAAKDLIPVVSWLWLRGKCRYCGKPIPDSPLIELSTALLFAISYIYWPELLQGWQIAVFCLWLAILVGLVALSVYDLRWYLLPNRLIYPLSGLAIVQAAILILTADDRRAALIHTALAVIVGGGIFYVIYQISKGKWIGGGDVRLGWLLGLIVATPAKGLLFIFLAAVGGTIISVPLLASGRLKRNAIIPFGPFLILGAIITVLFGTQILNWYQGLFL